MRGGTSRPGRERATEFQGKTVDDAIRAASHQFRVPPDEIEIEVVDEGRVGFLGLGAKEAVIRARMKPQQRRSAGPDDRRGNRSGGAGSSGGGGGGGRDRRPPQPTHRPVDRGMVQGGTTPGVNPFGRDRDEETPGQARPDGGRRRRRGGRGRRDENRSDHAPRHEGQERRPAAPPRADWRERQDRAPRVEHETPRLREAGRETRPPRVNRDGVVPTQDTVLEKEISAFVSGLLERMGFPGTVSSRFEDGAYCLTVEAAGDKDGVLIGRKGETLDALQHVAYKMSGRGRDDASTVRIDIAGYLERRENELAQEAVEMAKEVASTKRPRQTEPMRAAERRIVHRAISEIEGVTTRAIGTGLVKRISIEIEGSEPSSPESDAPRSDAPRSEASRHQSSRREIPQRETSARESAGPAPAAPVAAGRDVLDFVSQKGPDRSSVAEPEKVSSSEWGRKPRPARPGRRR